MSACGWLTRLCPPITRCRTVRRDLARYEQLMVDERAADAKEEAGWKLLTGDVFRAPASSKQLCVHVGSGVQVGQRPDGCGACQAFVATRRGRLTRLLNGACAPQPVVAADGVPQPPPLPPRGAWPGRSFASQA